MPAQPLRRPPDWRKRILVALVPAVAFAVAAVGWSVYTVATFRRTSGPGMGDAGIEAVSFNPFSPPPPPVEPTRVSGELAPVPAGLADVLYLAPGHGIEGLPQQLTRQALWLAAREDFGLRVPDAHAGDPAPKNLPADRHLRLAPTNSPDQYVGIEGWRIAVGPAPGDRTVWQGHLPKPRPLFAQTPEAAIEAAERMSRELMPKCLVAARFAPKPNRLSDAPVPAAVEAWLGQMREAAQFAALRLLHAEVRAKGESPALLDGLARGYANLGMLTEHHWGKSSAVFQARSLLYAQRQLARSPKSAAAVRTRAYAAALAGRHDLALTDLAAAAKLAAADPAAPPPPAWLETVDAFVHFDAKRLAAVRAKGDTPLARVLEFIAAEDPESAAVTLRAAQAVLEDEPECYLVHDTRCRAGGVGNLHSATRAGPEQFVKSLPGRVREQPGLPPAVARQVADGRASEAQVYAALRAAGDPAADRGEPSWAVLAATLQDARFVMAWHRLHFVAKKLATDAARDYADVADALRSNPLFPLLRACATDPGRDPAGYRAAVLAVPFEALDSRAMEFGDMIHLTGQAAATPKFGGLRGGNSSLYRSQVRAVRFRPGARTVAKPKFPVETIAVVSPNSPLAATARAFRHAADPVGELAALEKAYPDSAMVQRAVGERHLLDRRYDDAARCYGRSVALSPDAKTYRALAAGYLAKGDEALWLQTLEASLAADDAGLEHAQVRVQLAEHFMAKGDYRRADRHAVKAAESYASWALLCAAQCKVGLKDWDAANAFYRANAERYDGQVFNWYFSCRFSGHADRAAARAATQAYLDALPDGVPPERAYDAARFYLLTDRPAVALPLFVRATAAPNAPSVAGGLLLALTADGLGDVAAREKGVHVALQSEPADTPAGKTAAALRGWLAGPRAPQADAIEDALRGLAAAARADAEFFAGWLLANRGEAARAAGHWQRCVDAEAGTRSLKTHAKVFLEAHAAAGGDR